MLTTSEIIKKYNLFANKSLGQNFLTDPSLLNKIVGFSKNINNQNLLEIGPGPGGLTIAILKNNPKKFITIDMDKRCIDIVKQEIQPYYSNLETILGNALTINESEIFNKENFSIIANLPYNIGTALIIKWIENSYNYIDEMTLLLQKEVVERIVSKPNTKIYGKISVLIQYLYNVKKCCDIKPESFFPQPKVTSSVINLTKKYNNIDLNIIQKLSNITQISFGQRRKTLYNNLKKYLNNIDEIFQKLQLPLNIRAENLDYNIFLKIIELADKS